MTRISGRKAASASRNVRQAEKASARSDETVLPGRDPTRGASWATSQSRSAPSSTTSSTAALSLASASSGPSDSRMPACAFTISPRAQKVTPSP